jgi:hypothetical protein
VTLNAEVLVIWPRLAHEGSKRLSDRQKGDSISTSDKQRRPGGDRPEKKPGKQRASDVGRALRSVYDETLREEVPDDFSKLLGKLS